MKITNYFKECNMLGHPQLSIQKQYVIWMKAFSMKETLPQ